MDFLKEHHEEVDNQKVAVNLSTATDDDPFQGYTIYVHTINLYL